MYYPKNISKFTKTAVNASVHAGGILKGYFNKHIKIDFKGKIDPVTTADKLSQKEILKIIKKDFPAHSAIGEEDKKHVICDEYCWIVDPLDGTVNFIHGLPIFAVSIALSHKGGIISGVVYAPVLNEMFVAEKGKGAWLNGNRIQVSGINTLIRSLVVTGFPYYIYSRSSRVMKNFTSVLPKVQGLRRLGSAAIDLAYVACGRFEAFWEEGLSPWDLAAGALLVEEAGGRVSDFNNGRTFLWGKTLVASNKVLHKKMLKLISP